MSELDLSAKQERVLVALMGTRTLDDAAARAEVGQRTLAPVAPPGCLPASATTHLRGTFHELRLMGGMEGFNFCRSPGTPEQHTQAMVGEDALQADRKFKRPFCV